MNPRTDDGNLHEFVGLLSELRGVIELKLIEGEDEAWIGLRVGRQRPPQVLLQQVNRAAIGFGLDVTAIHFGILAD
ncbi:MAG: hypothetical protein JRF63_08625 [Deltaproteobacteria bacterium]|nr:hypothetical protein [Deltaproteobacteria bacterium]